MEGRRRGRWEDSAPLREHRREPPRARGLPKSFQQPREANSSIISGWQVRKLRLRQAKSLAQRHMAGSRGARTPTQGSLMPESLPHDHGDSKARTTEPVTFRGREK